MVAFTSSIFFSKLSYKYVNVIGQKQLFFFYKSDIFTKIKYN